MKDPKFNLDNDDKLPESFVEELNQYPNLSSDISDRFNYIKNDFIKFIESEFMKTSGFIEILYEITGEVVHKIDSIIEGLGPLYQVQPLLSRGLNSKSINDGNTTFGQKKIVSQLLKSSDGVIIQISFFKNNGDCEIEIELLAKNRKKRIRPFKISVNDAEGKVMAEMKMIGITNNAPRFPNPSTGIYIFTIEWEDKKETLSIKLR